MRYIHSEETLTIPENGEQTQHFLTVNSLVLFPPRISESVRRIRAERVRKRVKGGKRKKKKILSKI